MSGDEKRTLGESLTEALIRYLYPKAGPQEESLKAYGASSSDIALLKLLPEEKQQQLVRLCDVSPITAPDLIRFVTDALHYARDDGFNEGYDSGNSDGRKIERRSVRTRLQQLADQLEDPRV